MSQFELRSERLLLRPWQRAERETFAALTRDVEVTRYLTGGVAYTEEQIDEFYDRQERQLAEHGFCMGALVDAESGRIIGISGTQPLATGVLEIGWILERNAWGRGLASEAGRMMLRYVLETLERPRAIAVINPDNAPSKKVAERIGMWYEGRFQGAEIGFRHPEVVLDVFVKDR
ncbi:MAG TPA: GNAT family N-acetyltransferase [Thermoanaerobaculia bacterium]|nr:GNAT family N-acetyltransferase [Thermoanaerobaculia bacterium]